MRTECKYCGVKYEGVGDIDGRPYCRNIDCDFCMTGPTTGDDREYEIVVAITRLTDSFNEKADELIAILRDKDVRHHPMYKKEASNHTGEIEAQDMFKECDCFCKYGEED